MKAAPILLSAMSLEAILEAYKLDFLINCL